MPHIPNLFWFLLLGLIVLIFLGSIFKLVWKVAEPNEALLISGRKTRVPAGSESTDESLTFRIVTGGGAIVIPGLQTSRSLLLNLVETTLDVDCVTRQGIKVIIKGSVIFKIGDTYPEIANAARRFLDQQEVMESQVHSIFSGHLRAIVGNMTVEELISDREALRANVRDASGTEMTNLGLKIDSMQILEIGDPSGYIANLAAPHVASAETAARIAKAESNQEATLREQTASIAVAESQTAAAKRQSELSAEADAARELASQAGPLALAQAQLKVTEAQTHAAELQANLRERQLETEVRRPADARAYETTVSANAQRDADIAVAEAQARTTTLRAQAEADATKLTGAAEGEATRLRGEGEAAAIKARGDALRDNQGAVLQQSVVDRLPEIMAAAASPFASIDNLTVLDGGDGINKMVMGIIAQVGAILPSLMTAVGQDTTDTSPKGLAENADK